MKIGFDYWNVLTQHPEVFKVMAQAYLDAGHEVHIISAYGNRQLAKYGNTEAGYLALVQTCGIPYTQIHLVYFHDWDDGIPELKYDVIRTHGIEVMFDDRKQTIDYLHEKGIAAFLVPKPLKK